MHNCLQFSYFGKSLRELEGDGEQVAVAVSGNLSANESVVLLSACIEGAGIYASRQHMPARSRAMLDFLVKWFGGEPGLGGSMAHLPSTIVRRA
jgi:hypothetical protein